MAVTRLAALCFGALCFVSIAVGSVNAREAEPSKTELDCLAKAMYFEARGEPEEGRLAVGRVVLNRAASGDYPTTVCGVVYQNDHMRNRCQFSFACDGVADKVTEQALWDEIKAEAKQLLGCRSGCRNAPDSGDAIWTSTHYHASYVSPHWAKKLKRTGTVGQHLFYAAAST
jgi:spore germination cell wall hydrolase CwlJ-like protein